MSATVKAVTRVSGPFPKIEAGSLICPISGENKPLILLVLEIVTATRARCMVMEPGETAYRYAYIAYWDHREFVLWQGELTITQ